MRHVFDLAARIADIERQTGRRARRYLRVSRASACICAEIFASRCDRPMLADVFEGTAARNRDLVQIVVALVWLRPTAALCVPRVLRFRLLAGCDVPGSMISGRR